MKTNLALVFAALLVVLAAGEFTVRILQHFQQLPDYRKGSHNQPAQHVRAPKYRRSSNEQLYIEHDVPQPGINAWGTRDPAFDIQRGHDVIRIAVIGDSVSFGYGLTYEQSYPAQLQSSLQQQLVSSGLSHKVEVLNFAVSGYGLDAYQALYDSKVRQFAPDLVLIGYVQNDIAPTHSMVQSVGDSMKAIGTRKKMARISQLAAWIYEQAGRVRGQWAFAAELRQYQRDDVIATSVAQLDRLYRSISADGAKTLVLVFPYFIDFADYPLHKVHHSLTASLQQRQLPVCDLLPAFSSHPSNSWRLAPDDYVHPNAAGAELAARAAYNCIRQFALPPFSTVSLAIPAG